MTKDLQAAYDTAIAKAYELQADKDAAIAKVKAKYSKALQDANDQAAQAQQALRDAQATGPLLGRPDGDAVAKALGLTLPTD